MELTLDFFMSKQKAQIVKKLCNNVCNLRAQTFYECNGICQSVETSCNGTCLSKGRPWKCPSANGINLQNHFLRPIVLCSVKGQTAFVIGFEIKTIVVWWRQASAPSIK